MVRFITNEPSLITILEGLAVSLKGEKEECFPFLRVSNEMVTIFSMLNIPLLSCLR